MYILSFLILVLLSFYLIKVRSYFLYALALLLILGLPLLGLKSEPMTPYISQIEASSQDLTLLTKELKFFDAHVSKNLLTNGGNYPITIGFEKFTDTDEDSLGFAIVDNYGCDIKLNLSEKWTRNKFRLVLYHELGHCFGLDHDNPTSVMGAEYEEDVKQTKSLPQFYKYIDRGEKNIIVSNTGIEWWDEKVNEQLDSISFFPENKDSFKRKEVKTKHTAYKVKLNESKKIDYKEN